MKSIFTGILVTGVAQQITGSNTVFNSAVFFGYKGFNASGIPIANLAPINIGTQTGQMFLQVGTGSSISFNCPEKHFEDLANFWVNGNQSDGIYVIAYP